MKKITAFVLVAVIIAAAALIPGTAANEKKTEVRMALIFDGDSVKGSAENVSLFDRVLDAVVASGQSCAFFFDLRVGQSGDCASALMKTFCSNLPWGVYDSTNGGDMTSVGDMLSFQKYVVKTTSRLVLTGAGALRRYDGSFAAFSSGLVVPPSFALTGENLANYAEATVSVTVSAQNANAIVAFFESLADENIKIITPTETGYR
ncbi:MAG: hypothetical protein IJQ37_00680 [Clostridia bacterium]|nr:hypothetical protein [Clostridia bacterium]